MYEFDDAYSTSYSRNQCRASDTQVTLKARGPLVYNQLHIQSVYKTLILKKNKKNTNQGEFPKAQPIFLPKTK